MLVKDKKISKLNIMRYLRNININSICLSTCSDDTEDHMKCLILECSTLVPILIYLYIMIMLLFGKTAT
jgi:hypothetical protein